MKKTIFTNPRWITGWLFAITFLSIYFTGVNSATAQCTLAANDLGYLSIDSEDCISEITADMILESPQSCPGAIWQVIVYDDEFNPLNDPADNVVTSEQIGETVYVQVMDLNSGNMTPYIPMVVLDKVGPYWLEECPVDTVDLYCWQEAYYKPAAEDACDVEATVIQTNEVVYENICDPDDPWPTNVLRIIDKSFVAYDSSGNYSEACDVTLRVNAIPWDSLINPGFLQFPINRTVAGQNPISCSEEYETTMDGCCQPTGCPVPEYEGAGVPFLNIFNEFTGIYDTLDLFPGGYFPCNVVATYIDILPATLDPACVKTFYRMWSVTVIGECFSFPPILRVQTIEIADLEDPVVVCPENETINTNTVGEFENTINGTINCGATYSFPVPEMYDECSPELTWNISIMNDNGYPIEFVQDADPDNPPFRALPLGVNKVVYSVYDLCGNSDVCEFFVTVDDNTAPVAVCQQFTTVSLTYDGYAEVFAPSFDSGSYDDCLLDYYEVKRMDDGVPCGIEDGHLWNDHVTFCCNDIGEYVMVQFRVWDVSGNSNECMVQVEVQDKIGPYLDCPSDMEVNCSLPYNLEDLDPYFGEATAYDNCNNLVVDQWYDDSGLDQCGTGVLIRYFSTTDSGGRTVTCDQHIYFFNPDPFWIDQQNPSNPNDDVIWPDVYQGSGCMNPADLHPDVTGWPELLEGPCDLAGATWSDDVFAFNDNDLDAFEACFKIIRHWKVIDWCQHDPIYGGVYMAWTYDQIIMVSDPDGPTITSDCEDKTTCTYDPDCTDGYIELTMSATDICTDGEDLRWFYKIDYNNDNNYGSFDYESDVLYGANVQALGEFENGEFEIGTHRIYWTVWDQCGNKSTCEYDFTIMNCKKPTPYCIDHIATTLMGMDTDGDGETDWGEVEVTALDCAPCCLDAVHPCTYDIEISFSEDWTDKTRLFDCDDFGENTVEIWATAFLPDGTVTQDYCVTTIDIQDNFDVCNNGPDQMVDISGSLNHFEGGPIAGVTVDLIGSELAPVTTDAEGTFAFTAQSMHSYEIVPARDGGDTEGVTTLDLVLIQKHLLALKELESPYSMLAADVDANGKISAADLYTMRQLILGINDQFINTNSWTFVDAEYEFLNPSNPFNENVPAISTLENIVNDTEVAFIGVKMGDINNTVALNGGQDLENRSVEALKLNIDELSYNGNEELSIPVYATDFNQINGFQLTLDFNTDALMFNEIEGASLNIGMSNLGLTKIEEGKIALSWSEAKALTLTNDEVLFTLNFTSLKNGSLNNSIGMSNAITNVEAYNADLEVIDLELNVRTEGEFGFELFQNSPNPFSQLTTVSFSLPAAGSATLTIQDITGRILKSVTGDFNKGINTIEVKKSELGISGILYYQLDSEGHTATKKMVVLN